MIQVPQVTYAGVAPGADANVYSLFDTVKAFTQGARAMAMAGVVRVTLNLKNSQAGTLKWYKSTNRGATWNQIGQEAIAATPATTSLNRDYEVTAEQDWKLEWTNGGAAQATWLVDIGMSDVFNGPTADHGSSATVTTPGVQAVAEQFQPAAEDNVVGVFKVEERFGFLNVVGAATTVVKNGAGLLHRLIINLQVASATITIYDNTAGSGTKVGTITFPAALLGSGPISVEYDLLFATGLTIVTTGALDITAVYR